CSLPQFIVMLLHYAPYLQFQIQSVQRGAVLGGLNTRTIAGLQIAVPPIAEQALLLDEIERQTKCLDKSIGMVDREMVLLRAYRTRLIADVVTGKLEVREAAAKLPEEPEEPELVEEIEEQVEGEEETEEADLAMASEETILAD
ncbi:MAG: hypothetical protein KDI55_29900, partial [Anaerolineae bacterium]|nr:hypothetical protein [Anaerolineae bacterium]